MLRVLARGLVGVAVLCWAAGPVQASSASARAQVAAPSAAPVRISPSDAPIIDGSLSDPVWGRAAVIDQFQQVSPDPGGKPTERTQILLLYDRYALFIGIHCYDDPSKIVATYKAHDGNAGSGDLVRVNLDPLLTRRDGYGFEIDPLGGYVDGILQDNSTYLKNWNLVWQAKAHIVSDGWTAELEIPFRELSYDPRQTVWGLQIIRQIKREAEHDSWAPLGPSLSVNDLSDAGTLTGMSGLSEGKGLDVQLFGVAQTVHTWGSASETDELLRPGGTVYYKITPALTGTVTANPDFSDAPLDMRQLNTTRFSLFFPESRQFFLQDAAQFQYGGLAFTPPMGGGPARMMRTHNGQPFFSRTIGLVNGVPVGILGGAKLSGEIGGIQVGALSVRTQNDLGIPAQTLSVERVSVPVLESSSVGLVSTQGDPTGLSRNSLAGADFRYLNPHIGGTQQQLQADGFYERSSSSLVGSDAAYGASIELPNEPWSAAVDFKQIGTSFAPALGFANRLGIRRYAGEVDRRTRLQHSFLDWYEYGTSSIYVSGLDNSLQSGLGAVWVDFFDRYGDELDLQAIERAEDLPAPFDLPGDVVVSPGPYRWQHLDAHVQTSLVRPLSLGLDVQCCHFFGGSDLDTNATVEYRPDSTFDFQLEDHRLQLDLLGRHRTVQALNGTVFVNFTPDMQIAAQLEYDDIDNSFNALVRYNWQYRPGQYLLLSLGEDAQVIGRLLLMPDYHSHATDFLIRFERTLQF